MAHDLGLGLFAGLAAIPKTTAITTYSYRCEHALQTRLLSALGQAMRRSGLSAGEEFDLDFHAIMHYGNDPVLEEHYVPRRSQRTASILSFFAQDSGTHNIVYANADLLKADHNQEVVAFCDHWRQLNGEDPKLLVLDSKVTTHAMLSLETLRQPAVVARPLLHRHIPPSPRVIESDPAKPTDVTFGET